MIYVNTEQELYTSSIIY